MIEQLTPDAGDPWHAAILNLIREALIGTTLDGYVVLWNDAAQQLLGHVPQDVLGFPRSFLTAEGHETRSRHSSAQKGACLVPWRCREGGIRALQVIRHIVFDASGRPAGSLEMLLPSENGAQAIDSLHQRIARQTHLLSEAMTAIASYMCGCQHLLERDEGPCCISARDALGRAIGQVPRVRDVITELRWVASALEQKSDTSE